MVRRVSLVLFSALVLVGCRLDVEVSVDIEPDGSGMVVVEAVADAGLIARAPELADQLELADAVEAGWSIAGPEPTDDGGLRLRASHPFSSTQELANILNSIGPPLIETRAGRVTEGEQTTNAVEATLQLADGFASFADADLLEVVGGVPFADRLAEAESTPDSSMGFTLRITMPGEVISATGTEVEPNTFEWIAPLDGSAMVVAASTVQRPAAGGNWARPVAIAAFVAMVVWILLAIALFAAVITARRRRVRRPRGPGRPATARRAP